MESCTYPLELEEWVTNILGVSLATLDEWTDIFTKRRAFEDEIIAEAITGFLGKPLQEQSLYKPFCTFGNRVLDLGREDAHRLLVALLVIGERLALIDADGGAWVRQ